MKIKISIFAFLLTILLVVPLAQAATVTVSQSGADAGTIMKGKSFTITVSGLSGSGTVNLVDTPTGFSSGEGTSKAFSSGTTSVSWTTATISQAQTAAKIKVSVSVTGSPSTAESSSFDVILPPSLSGSTSPTSLSVNKGSSFTLNLNVQNWGETTARDVTVSVTITASPGVISITYPIPTISTILGGIGGGGESIGRLLTITAPSTVGTYQATITATPSNADPWTGLVTLGVNPVCGDGTCDPGETTTSCPADCPAEVGAPAPSVPGVPVVETKVNVTRGKATITIPSIAAGKMAEVSITKDINETNVRKITISVKNSVNNIKIEINKVEQKPAEVIVEVVGKVYHYLKIDKENITDDDIDNATIQFQVEKLWIANNNINETTVALNRYINDTWNKLSTSKVNETDDYIYYEAISPGLSVFAISGEEEVEVAPPVVPTKICTPAEKQCVDNDLQQCNPDGTAWLTIQTCTYGCDPATLACKEKPAPPVAPPKVVDYTWIIIIIVIVIVTIGGVYYSKVYKKKSSIV